MRVEVLEGMGHGQFLNEHPKEYSGKMKKILYKERSPSES